MIHIGKEIARVMAERGLNNIGLARLLGYRYTARITRILKKEEVSTDLLMRISKALKYNFLKLLSQEVEKEIPSNEPPPPPNLFEKEALELRKENADLKEKISYLKTIQELVMKKK